jgi:hypothetical protein
MDDEEEPAHRGTIIGLFREQDTGATTAAASTGSAVHRRPATRRVAQRDAVHLAHARAVLAAWKHDYNNVLPHGSLGGPTKAAKRCAIPGLRAPPHCVIEPIIGDEAWDPDQHLLWGTYTSAAHERKYQH